MLRLVRNKQNTNDNSKDKFERCCKILSLKLKENCIVT